MAYSNPLPVQLQHLRREEHALPTVLAAREIHNGVHPHHSLRCLTPSFPAWAGPGRPHATTPETEIPGSSSAQGDESAQGVIESEGAPMRER